MDGNVSVEGAVTGHEEQTRGPGDDDIGTDDRVLGG
jgi:hypothetical protein